MIQLIEDQILFNPKVFLRFIISLQCYGCRTVVEILLLLASYSPCQSDRGQDKLNAHNSLNRY